MGRPTQVGLVYLRFYHLVLAKKNLPPHFGRELRKLAEVSD